MPKKCIDHSKTIIYKIVCLDDPSFVYVGSTTEFVQRKAAHKTASRKSDLKVYQTIREHGGWENVEMIPVKKYPCASSLDARMEEERIRIELCATNLGSQIEAARIKIEGNFAAMWDAKQLEYKEQCII